MRPTILIADSDRDCGETLAAYLEESGYEVIVVSDGEEALAQARKRRPDLLILDIDLPAGRGVTVQERKDAMKALASVPVVYVTASTAEQTRLRAETSGAALLHKPFELEKVRGTVELVLADRAA